MAQGEMRAVSIAARAAAVSYSTTRNRIADHVNNAGFFSPSMWGTNPKLASLCGDITVKRWARAWIIDNGGHRAGKKNMVTADFNQALHEFLGFVWDPMNKTMCDGAARNLMKCDAVGAI
jgi:hypothetical protein